MGIKNDYYYKGEGIGLSKKGIPPKFITNSTIKSHLIESEDAYFGYLVNDKSAYYKLNASFQNKEIAEKYRKQRLDYIKSSLAEVEHIIKALNSKTPLVGIAFDCVKARNKAKIIAREGMNPQDITELEKRNMKLYYNPIGPDLDTAIILNQARLENIPKNKLEQMMEISEARLNNDTKKDGSKLTSEELNLNEEYNKIYQRAIDNSEDNLNAYKRIILSSLKKDEEACILLGIDPQQVEKSFKKFTSADLFE